MREENELPKELIDYLEKAYKNVSYGRKPIKISEYGGSIFVRFNKTETYKISLGRYQSNVTLDKK